MVAFVGGSGLGLFNSSLMVVGGDGARGDALLGRSGEQVYVNAGSGNLVVQRQDEYVSATGGDLSILRTYNSQGLLNDDNADNWRMGVAKTLSGLTGTLNTAGSTVTRTEGDGAVLRYSWDGAKAAYVNKDGAGAFDTLKYDAAAARWTWTDGASQSTERYDWAGGAGKVLSCSDANGNLTLFGYANANAALVTSVTSASGESTYLDYIGSNLQDIRTVRADGSQATRVRYTYDGGGRMNLYKLYADGRIGDYRYAFNAGDATRTDSISVKRDGIEAITYNNYDANGFIAQVTTSGSANTANARTLTNDVRGRVLKKVQDGHTTYSLIANEEVIGSSSDEAAPVVDTFRSSYVPITSDTLAAGPSAYTVQPGETLQSIAKSVWGNANLWYLIADANGKTAVATGEVITIPGKQNTIRNDYQTFAPYSPGKAVGDQTPLAQAPKKKSNFWNPLAMFVADFKFAVAPTVRNTLNFIHNQPGVAYGEQVIMRNPALYAMGRLAAGAVTTYFTGYSWGAAAWDAYFAYERTGSVTQGLKAGAPGLVAAYLPAPGPALGGMVQAAANNMVTQGVAIAMGQQQNLNWAGVGGSALGVGAGQLAQGSLVKVDFGFGEFGNQLTRGTLSGIAAGTTAAVARGGTVSAQQIAIDAFGNALGSSWADPASGGSTTSATGDFARMDGDSYRSVPYEIPNAGGGLQFGRSSVGLQLTPGASVAMDEGLRDARGQRVLVAMRDSDMDAEAARLNSTAQKRASLVTTAHTADAGAGRGFVNPGPGNPYTNTASLSNPATNSVAASTDRIGNWLNGFNLPEIPGVGWLSREQGLSSATYWKGRLDQTGNPIYAVAQSLAGLWADHSDEVGMALSIRGGAAKGMAQSSAQGDAFSRHLGYIEKYGTAGVQELESGQFRYYGEVQPASKPGEMIGRRYVHEFDAVTGESRGWHETIDGEGSVRQIRPELNNGKKTHYRFDKDGKYVGSW